MFVVKEQTELTYEILECLSHSSLFFDINLGSRITPIGVSEIDISRFTLADKKYDLYSLIDFSYIRCENNVPIKQGVYLIDVDSELFKTKFLSLLFENSNTIWVGYNIAPLFQVIESILTYWKIIEPLQIKYIDLSGILNRYYPIVGLKTLNDWLTYFEIELEDNSVTFNVSVLLQLYKVLLGLL